MDNKNPITSEQNSPNWPNNPDPLTPPATNPASDPPPPFSPPLGGSPITPDTPTPQQTFPSTPPDTPQSATPQAETPAPIWPLSPTAPEPNLPTAPQPPLPPTPSQLGADSIGIGQNQPPPTWTPPSQPAEPISTSSLYDPSQLQPEQIPPPETLPSADTTALSPQVAPTFPSPPIVPSMDNPLGALNPSLSEPTLETSVPLVSEPAALGQNPPPMETQIPPQTPPFESAPTDLSHLITNTNEPLQPTEANLPSVSVPENLVVQSSGNPEVPNIPTPNGHKGFPKWLIGVGVGLLLVVAGASAFFILGIGQPSKTSSLPATQAPKNTPQPSSVSTPRPTTQASPSGGFGQFEGTPAATLAPTPKPATSAAELLKQRNQ